MANATHIVTLGAYWTKLAASGGRDAIAMLDARGTIQVAIWEGKDPPDVATGHVVSESSFSRVIKGAEVLWARGAGVQVAVTLLNPAVGYAKNHAASAAGAPEIVELATQVAAPMITSAVAPVASDLSSRGILVQSFGARGDGAVDDTAAFNAAISSGQTVIIPGGRTYLIAGQLLDGGGAIMVGVGQPTLRCTRSQGYYLASGAGSYWSGIRWLTTQTGNSYQGEIVATAIGNVYEDMTFLEANSGWRVRGSYNRFSNFLWRNARGQCMRFMDETCHDNEVDGAICENGNQGLVLSEAYSYNNKFRRLRKYINRQTINIYLLGQINAAGQLGADVFACVTESHGNSVSDFWGKDFKEGGVTFTGDRNTCYDGYIENTGGSAVNAGGSSNRVQNVRAKDCKNGFSCIGQAGGTAQPNTFIQCKSEGAKEIGFRGADGAYRRWTPGVQTDTAPTAYCYYRQNIYQTAPPSPTRVTEFGTIPPTHTSGIVSDGLVYWQHIKTYDGRLASDNMICIACESSGSVIADWFTESGRMTLIGCPGFDPIFEVPHARGLTANALPDPQAKPQRTSPVLVNGDFAYWEGATELALTTALAAVGGWSAARASGAGFLARVSGQRTPFAVKIGRAQGDAATGDVRLFQVIRGDDLEPFKGKPVAIGFRSKALTGLSSTNWQIAVHVYSSASPNAVPASGVPTSSTTVFSQTFNLTEENLPYSTTVPVDAAVVPPDAQVLVVRWSFAPRGTAGSDDGFILEAPTLTPGKIAQAFEPQAVVLTKMRLGV